MNFVVPAITTLFDEKFGMLAYVDIVNLLE